MERATRPLNPFPGLRAFQSDEDHLFFGREEQTARLLGILREQRFVAVVGTSGSGKSSLVRAGLIPALHGGTMAHAGTHWEMCVMRPGGDPLRNLAAALIEADLYDAKDPDALPRLKATLSRSRFGLTEAVRQSDVRESGANLLVVVDQFEELFRFRVHGAAQEEASEAFIKLLLTASREESPKIYVVLTMRSDYLGDCAQIPGLAEAVNQGEYLIPRLTRNQQRAAIEKPVGVGRAKIAPRLVQQLLNDVGGADDQLPVLQHALMRTWDVWTTDHAPDEPVDLRHYESTGGLAEALSRHADEIFEGLPDDAHRDAAARAFKALTVKGADNRGIRRPTRLERLGRLVGADEAAVRAVIEAYRQPGVTFLMPGVGTPLAAEQVIDLSHESLMRVWRRLSGWVEEEAQSARIYRRLADTAALWQEKRAGLYHDPDLQIARTWCEGSRPNAQWAEQYGGGFEAAMAFLDQSREAADTEERVREAARRRELEQAKRIAEAERQQLELQQAAARRLRVFAAGLAVVAMAAVGAFFFAMDARRKAVNSAQLASKNEQAAAQSATEAKRAAKELERTLVQSDFEQGVQHIEAGQSAEGLPHLARALRTDPGFAPAALRALSTLASGRFPLETFPPLAQERVITTWRWNEKEDLLFTSDAGDGVEKPERFVWDGRTGKRLYDVGSGKKMSGDTDWTEDGSLLVSYLEEEKKIQTWDARSGKEVSSITAEALNSFRLGQHPEAGPLIVARSEDWALRVYRAATGEAVGPTGSAPLERAGPAADGFGFTPDGRRVYGLCSDATIALWDALSGAPVDSISTRPYRTPQEMNATLRGGVFFSPDGSTVVARAPDGKHLNWWRIGEKAPPAAWLEFPEFVQVFFLPGGRKAAFLSFGTLPGPLRVVVHELATRAETARIETPRPVGNLLGAWDYPWRRERPPELRFPVIGVVEANVVRLWDLETGGILREVLAPALLSRALLSPDGRKLVTVSIADEVMLWDLFTGQPLWSEAVKIQQAFFDFTPDGEKLLINDGAKRMLEVRDSRTGRPLREPVARFGGGPVLFPAGGRYTLVMEYMETTSGANFRKQTTGRFKLLDLGLRPQLFEPLFAGSGEWSAYTIPAPDGSSILALTRQGTRSPQELVTFDASARRPIRSLPLPPGTYGYRDAFRLTPDGRQVVLGCSDGRARILDPAKGEVLHELVHDRAVMTVAISRDGSRLATGTDQGKVRVWDLTTGAPLFEPLDQGDQAIKGVSFSPDGALVASGSQDFKVRLVDARTGKARFEPLTFPNIVNEAVFSSDGAYLAANVFAEDVPIIETSSGKVLRKLHHSDACRAISFSPDGEVLAIATGGNFHLPIGQVILWAWREGRRLGQPLETHGAVGELSFSADGALLATGTVLPTGGTVQVWDVASRLPVTDPVVGRGQISSVDFRPGAAEVIAAWQDGTIRVIDLPPSGAVAPEKLAQLAEAVCGKRFAAQKGGLEDTPREELERVRAEAGTPWWQWFFSTSETRTISPGSKMTLREYLARLRKSSLLADLQDALRLASADGLTHARIALVLIDGLAAAGDLDRDKQTAARLSRHWQDTAAWYAGRAVEIEPRNAEAWALQAEVLERLGRKDDAARAVARAMELEPSRAAGTSPNARYLQAVAMAQERKWTEADPAFAAALEGLKSEAARSDGVPLLGVLADLAPIRAPAGYREIKLPAAIPQTFEDFEGTPEGQVPAGWNVSHERIDAFPLSSAASRLDAAESDAFDDWTTVSWDRVVATASAGPPFQRNLLLTRGVRERIDGASPFSLLGGRFLLALSAERNASAVQRVLTPVYDLSGRTGVHVVFHSAMEQAGELITALESTIDGGATWLPVEYRLNAIHVVHDAAGKLDAAATLTKRLAMTPLFIDEEGRSRGGALGDFLGAKVSRALDDQVHGMRRDIAAEGKRVEVYRLAQADGQPHVQLRFLQAGRYGWYWGLDRLGLYELPADAVTHPESIDQAHDPGFLANLALVIAFGTEKRPDPAENGELLFYNAMTGEAKPSSPSDDGKNAPGSNPAPESAARRALDALLVARRALTLAPHDPRVLAAAAITAGSAGELEAAGGWLRELRSIEPLHELHALGLLSHYRRWAASLEASGDEAAATALAEAGHVLAQAALGKADRGFLESLARKGLAADRKLLLPRGSEWKYLDTGTDPGPAWKDPAFDDGSWLAGPARLGYGGDGEKTVVGYGKNSRDKFITTYFRTVIDVADPGWIRQLQLSVARDDGVVVYLNGQEVVRDNMPAGEIGYKTTAVATVDSVEQEQKFFDFDVTAALRPGRNLLAAEVHQQNPTSSDLGFDLELVAIGAIKEPARDLDGLEAIEARLDLPAELRSAMWTARAEHARLAGDLDRAAGTLERAARLGPGNPGVGYERAMLQAARGDAGAASKSYREALEAALALKAGPRSSYTILLPATVKRAVEPIVHPTGLALAAAARRLLSINAASRDLEVRWLLEWSESLDREGNEARRERAEVLFQAGRFDDALKASEMAATTERLPAGAPPRRYRERLEWLGLRERSLRRLGKTAEADRVRDEIIAVPPRDPGRPPSEIDLTPHYTAGLYDGRNWHGDQTLSMLAETFRPRDGIGFDIRAMIQLDSGTYPQTATALERGKDLNAMYKKTYPDQVTGIRVDRPAKALHFLVATCHGNSSKEGTQVAQIVIHYQDGSQAEIPLIDGKDLTDWSLGYDTRVPTDRVVWVGSRPFRALYRKTWSNPSPEKPIASIDFVSAKREAAPFLVAATAE
jgi:WD40 repeat protein/energy-coupling factor transporter ATP-binding protein EcfA2